MVKRQTESQAVSLLAIMESERAPQFHSLKRVIEGIGGKIF